MNRRAATRAPLTFPVIFPVTFPVILLAQLLSGLILIATFTAGSPSSTFATTGVYEGAVSDKEASADAPSADLASADLASADLASADQASADQASADQAPVDPDEPLPTRPPLTVSDFYPEDRSITDCVGALERPGCGNKNRGGWGQYAVAAALALGMIVIFGNIARSVRRNERARQSE